MKKSIISLLLLFAVCTVFTEKTFAQTGQRIGQELLNVPMGDLIIINNYSGTDAKYKPHSFKITVKNNSIVAIDQPVPKGWTRTPSKFPPGSASVVWTNNSGDILNGEINLGVIHYGKAEKFSIVCQWINASGDVIYQTERLWTDYNPHDPGLADGDMNGGGKEASYQVKWTPVIPQPPKDDLKQTKQTGEVITPNLSQPRPGKMIYVGAGSNSPSTKLKDDAYATNNVGFDANVFVAVIKKKKFNFGFNAGGEYFSSNKENYGTLPAAFSVSGSTAENILEGNNTGDGAFEFFKVGVAPQINFFMGKHIIISPMIELGYMSMTNKGFSVIQTTNIDGTLYNFTLFSKTETKTSGLAMTPKVRLNYMFTKNIGMWIEGNYTVGPTVKSSITILVPEPEPDKNGQYNIDQMMNGTTKTEMRETKFGSFGVHVGVVFSILDVPDADDYPDL